MLVSQTITCATCRTVWPVKVVVTEAGKLFNGYFVPWSQLLEVEFHGGKHDGPPCDVCDPP